jgi:hypothetical protein
MKRGKDRKLAIVLSALLTGSTLGILISTSVAHISGIQSINPATPGHVGNSVYQIKTIGTAFAGQFPGYQAIYSSIDGGPWGGPNQQPAGTAGGWGKTWDVTNDCASCGVEWAGLLNCLSWNGFQMVSHPQWSGILGVYYTP